MRGSRKAVGVAAALAGILTLISSLGCGQTGPDLVGMPEARSSPPAAVTLTPGDVVDVKFFYVPELNETQAVRPDGRIALQLVGEVEAKGRTPAELREELYTLYTPHLKKPDVTVIVRSFQGRRIWVGGEVLAPGLIEMGAPLTALEAIMQAGGFNTRTARVDNIVIIRHQDGQRYGAALDMRPALEGKPTAEFYLEPRDVVYVPRSTIVKVTQWIDQHINQIIPLLPVEYSFPAGKGVVTIDLTRSVRVR